MLARWPPRLHRLSNDNHFYITAIIRPFLLQQRYYRYKGARGFRRTIARIVMRTTRVPRLTDIRRNKNLRVH